MERAALEDVLTCHLDRVPEYPRRLLIAKEPHRQAREVLVRRVELFELIKAHGKLCTQ